MVATKTKGKKRKRLFRESSSRQQVDDDNGPSSSTTTTTTIMESTTSPEELASLSTTTSFLDKETILIGASQPLIPEDIWNQMTGDEYDDPKVLDALAKTALHMATQHDNNGWIDWKKPLPAQTDQDLQTLLEKKDDNNNNGDNNNDILVYTGSALKSGFGSEVPWIKSISIIPMAPSEVADLMMDSSRVKTYNSLSLGRADLKVFPPTTTTTTTGKQGQQQQQHYQQRTKIVRNVVQLPVSNSKVESVTLLHTRQLENGAHLLVSRAIGGTKYSASSSSSDGATTRKVGRSYILLGVNLFEPLVGGSGNDHQCRMIAVTHAYSPGVPLMLAGKVGVKSAKNFVRDIRRAAACRVPAAAVAAQ